MEGGIESDRQLGIVRIHNCLGWLAARSMHQRPGWSRVNPGVRVQDNPSPSSVIALQSARKLHCVMRSFYNETHFSSHSNEKVKMTRLQLFSIPRNKQNGLSWIWIKKPFFVNSIILEKIIGEGRMSNLEPNGCFSKFIFFQNDDVLMTLCLPLQVKKTFFFIIFSLKKRFCQINKNNHFFLYTKYIFENLRDIIEYDKKYLSSSSQ